MSYTPRKAANTVAALGLGAVLVLAIAGGSHSTAAAEGPGETAQGPLVWLIMGLAGDEARYARYLETVQTLASALEQRCHVSKEDIRILFDRGAPSPYPACTAESLVGELDRIAEASRRKRPLWVFLLGHAATAKDEGTFHVQGHDVTMREMAEHLAKVDSASPLVLVLTTAASGNALKTLRGPNRTLVAACPPGAVDDETEFPHILARILAQPQSADVNADRLLSVAEAVAACRDEVAVWYQDQGLVCTEKAVVDGNGDGNLSQDGEQDDERCARAIGLRYNP